jgi:hypothetical protein
MLLRHVAPACQTARRHIPHDCNVNGLFFVMRSGSDQTANYRTQRTGSATTGDAAVKQTVQGGKGRLSGSLYIVGCAAVTTGIAKTNNPAVLPPSDMSVSECAL